MTLRCFFERRRFLPGLEGDLSRPRAERLEAHLARCPGCRDLFARVRAGHEAGRRFGRLGPVPPPRLPDLEEIREPAARPLVTVLVTRVLPAALAVGLAFFAVFRGARRDGPKAEGFAPLAIGEFATNERSRVFTEGFVHDVYFDEEERTLHIKLLESPRQMEPFVICEIRAAGGVTVPPEGSRIRVYGNARFDGQPGRGWHEVNPVAKIAVLDR
jgi:hypothetical protein